MIDVAVATSVPSPAFERQNKLFIDALSSIDLSSEVLSWQSAAGTRSYSQSARLTLLLSIAEEEARSHPFQTWVEHSGAEGKIVNSVDIVRLEKDKSYLSRLDSADVPTVPSMWCPSGASLEYMVARTDWAAFVIKSVVGGSVLHFERDEIQNAQQHFDSMQGGGILQPFLSQASSEGILQVHFIEGEFSHAIRQFPKVGEWRTQEVAEGSLRVDEPDGTQLEVATAAIAAIAKGGTFARVDLVRDIDGPPSVIQLRTTCPGAGLELVEGAADRVAKVAGKLLSS